MRISKVGVIIQNYIQYESFLPAIELMKERKIMVDILIPTEDKSEHIWDNMYSETLKVLEKISVKIKKGVQNRIEYDILFSTHDLEEFKHQKRKLYIKYRYGISTKPNYSLKMMKNIPFDLILCYGNKDAEAHCNFGKTYIIGNIKYAYYENKKNKKQNEKKVIVYLPTYGDVNSCNIVIPELSKLKNKYDIRIKLHHGTNYLMDENETKLKELVENNFNKIYDSSQSILDILKETDIVISDNSGAIGDAIATKIPVIVVPKDGSFCKYGDYYTIQEQLVINKLIDVAYKPKDIEKCINKILLNNQLKEKMDSAFEFLYSIENNKTGEAFLNLLDKIEKNLISEDYLLIRKNAQKEYNDILKMNENYELKNEILEERLKRAYEIIENLK